MAGRLLALLLYHPFRYELDPGHGKTLRRSTDALRQIAYRLEEVEYRPLGTTAPQGDRAMLLHPEGRAVAGLWMVFGGNAMVGSDWLPFFEELLSGLPADAARPAVLLIDYPGYGANSGQPSPRSVLTAQLAALRAALPRLAAHPGALNLLGHSLGAAAAAQLAARLPLKDASSDAAVAALVPGRLVLSAPFVSIEAMAQVLFRSWLLPTWALRLLVTHRWDNAAWVPRASRAGWHVSVIHGTRDEIVPTSMGKALRDAVRDAGGQCDFIEVPHASHNDLMGCVNEYASLMGLAADLPGRNAAL